MSSSAATPAAPATPLEAVIAKRIDFPTWLPAMLVKELREGLRQRGFVAALVGFQVIMTLFLIFAVAGGSGSMSYATLQNAYWLMLGAQLLIITPLRAVAGLQAELDARFIDLLMLTRLTAWRIVLGKWFSLVAQGVLLVIALLPYGVARYFFGSVDLLMEARIILLMLAASAVLTAAALWSSVLPKVARFGLVLVVVFLWQFIPGSFSMLFSTRTVVRGPGVGLGNSSMWWVALVDILLVLALCLIGAVRRLAPRAESQTLFTRLLPLLGFLPLFALRRSDAYGQALLTGIFFALIAILELGRQEEPMESHWTAWSRRGAWGRLVGRLVQPGWASAIEWVLVVAVGGVFAMWVAYGRFDVTNGIRLTLAVVFAVEALFFPVLLMTWMTRQFSHRLATGYGLLFIGASVLGSVAQVGTQVRMTGVATSISYVVTVLPIASFWSRMGPGWSRTLGPIVTVQLLIAVAVIVATWMRARPYRLQRRQFDAQSTEAPVV
jgi:hypothetical protein